eukprot:1173226-Prymnesium_polylepis.1
MWRGAWACSARRRRRTFGEQSGTQMAQRSPLRQSPAPARSGAQRARPMRWRHACPPGCDAHETATHAM